MKSKILIVFILVFTLIACSSCQYTKDENTDNTDASSQNSDVKYYTQEELNKMYEENKYPKAYIKDIDDEAYFNVFNVTIKNIRVTQDVSGLEENDFLDFDEDIKARITSDNKFKTYERTNYMVINGGLDIEEAGKTRDVQQELLLIDFVWTNTEDKKVESTLTPTVEFFKFTDFDEEFVIEADGHIQYESEDRSFDMSEGPAYFPQSQYKNSDNEVTRAKKFCVYDFEPHESLECTLGFVIDKDLEDDAYLALMGGKSGNLDTLVKIF